MVCSITKACLCSCHRFLYVPSSTRSDSLLGCSLPGPMRVTHFWCGCPWVCCKGTSMGLDMGNTSSTILQLVCNAAVLCNNSPMLLQHPNHPQGQWFMCLRHWATHPALFCHYSAMLLSFATILQCCCSTHTINKDKCASVCDMGQHIQHCSATMLLSVWMP